MPATTGFTGIGVELQMGDGATPTEVFSPVANVTSANLNTEADQVDATHLLSTSGYREYKQGFKSASVDFEYHFDPDDASQSPDSGMLEAYDTGESRNFKLDFTGADNGGIGAPTSNGVCSFSGVVTSHSVSVSEGMVTASGTISMSSSPTWGPAA
jgi:hypothetical protein